MKVLKYILITIVILLIGFLALGLFMPQVSYGHTITVDKPIEEAWAVHQDESKFKLWLKGFKSIDLISGEQGKVGSTYKVVVKPSPDQADFVMIETLKSIKETDHVTLSFDSDIMTFDQKTAFSEKDEKTTISTTSVGSGKGIFMKSMFALMELTSGSFQAQEVENFENLKTVINSNTTNYFPNQNTESDTTIIN